MTEYTSFGMVRTPRFCKIQQFYHQSFTVSRLKIYKKK
nr:MAG TPA: hypothetical protein [Caudoviricetes sp.]